jgi:hypothetical protein
MKCVCGYKGEDFGNCKLRAISTWEDDDGKVIENDNGVLEVFICPKCGTLKIEVEK